nr:MAG TPA: hypothetical protein [Caudoviricetes sp.]
MSLIQEIICDNHNIPNISDKLHKKISLILVILPIVYP